METKVVIAYLDCDLCEGDSTVYLPKHFDEVAILLKEGWQLDTRIHRGIITLDMAVVYHLVKYTEEEKQQLTPFEPSITSVISVPIEEVDSKLKDGYEIKELYAKTATLIKYQKSQQEVVPP